METDRQVKVGRGMAVGRGHCGTVNDNKYRPVGKNSSYTQGLDLEDPEHPDVSDSLWCRRQITVYSYNLSGENPHVVD